MFDFGDLQLEVKRRAIRSEAGTEYDDAVKNAINLSLFRISREAPWRVLRRKTYFPTVTSYTTGSGAVTVTNASKNVTITGATMLTDGVKVGRRIKFSGSGTYYTIRTITGQTTLTIDQNFDGTTSSTNTYEIYPQEEYNLPVSIDHRSFMWHEEYGYPYKMNYITEQDFIESNSTIPDKGVPTHYRQWGSDMILEQPKAASVMRISSSSASDLNIPVTVFGIVSGYPDYEIITTNATDGTTAVSGKKSFTTVERIVKSAATVGRITVDCNTANTTVAVLPVGDTTNGIIYTKIQLWPLPNSVFDMNVNYYKSVARLVNTGDVHELGSQFDEAIILLSTCKIKAQDNQSEATGFYNLYTDEIKNLRKTDMDKIDWMPQLKRAGQSSNADLGVRPNLRYRQVGSNYGPYSR